MTWNQERIDAVRNITGPPVTPAKADLLGALDEIESLRAELGRRPLINRPRFSGVADQHRIEANMVNGIIYHHPGDGPRNKGAAQ